MKMKKVQDASPLVMNAYACLSICFLLVYVCTKSECIMHELSSNIFEWSHANPFVRDNTQRCAKTSHILQVETLYIYKYI